MGLNEISPDSAGAVDGLNLYVYVGNNPLKYTDPTGYVLSLLLSLRMWVPMCRVLLCCFAWLVARSRPNTTEYYVYDY
jgi:hypothetical protein